MATPKNVVIDLDEKFSADDSSSLTLVIAGKERSAYKPKDTVGLLQSRLRRQAETDDSVAEELIRQALYAVLNKEDADEILDITLRMDNRSMNLKYVMGILEVVREHYGDEIEEDLQELGLTSGVKQPQDRKPKTRKAQITGTTASRRKAIPR